MFLHECVGWCLLGYLTCLRNMCEWGTCGKVILGISASRDGCISNNWRAFYEHGWTITPHLKSKIIIMTRSSSLCTISWESFSPNTTLNQCDVPAEGHYPAHEVVSTLYFGRSKVATSLASISTSFTNVGSTSMNRRWFCNVNLRRVKSQSKYKHLDHV